MNKEFKEQSKKISFDEMKKIIKIVIYYGVTGWFIWYIYHVHDYLGEFKLNFQWFMLLSFVVWLLFPYISEIEILGNKFKRRELEEKINSVNDKINSIEQSNQIENDLQVKMYKKQLDENLEIKQEQNNKEDFKNNIFAYQIIIELRIMNIYRKLKSKVTSTKQNKISFIEIIAILQQQKYITEQIFNDVLKLEMIFNKKNVNQEDYKFVKENYDRIVGILDEVYNNL